jgi:hypothetical protein
VILQKIIIYQKTNNLTIKDGGALAFARASLLVLCKNKNIKVF